MFQEQSEQKINLFNITCKGPWMSNFSPYPKYICSNYKHKLGRK